MGIEVDPGRVQKAEQLQTSLETAKAGVVTAIEALRVDFDAASSFLEENGVFEESAEEQGLDDDLLALKNAWTDTPNPDDLLREV